MSLFRRHVTDSLAAYLDNATKDRAHIEAHLATCDECRHDLEQVRLARAALEELPLVDAPDAIWDSIQAAANAARPQPIARNFRLTWEYAALALSLVILTTGYWIYTRPTGPAWQVVALNGAPKAANRALSGQGIIRPGDSIQTDSTSRARILVASIGSVDVGPDTAIQLLSTSPTEHRLALSSGAISAKISAPPRLFIVDTPAATAVDLGCEYQLQCNREGAGTLQVTSGWVALEWKGRESLVPGGASCRMYPGRGPGIPAFDDASPTFKAAVEAFDRNEPGALDLLLQQSRTRDTLTLWHMLSQANATDRIRVYDRMAALAPPPASVSREQVLALDRDTLTKWREELAWIW